MLLKKSTIFLLAILFSANLTAQNHTPRFNEIDIQHYIFDLKLSDKSDKIEGKATVSIQTEEKEELESIDIDAKKGVNVYTYHLTFSNHKKLNAKKAENNAYYLPKGKYVLDISINKKHSNTELKVK